MAVRVDQAGQNGSARGVDHLGIAAQLERFAVQEPLHLAVIANQNAGKAFQLAVLADLDATGITDQRIGQSGCGGGGEEQR